MPVVASASSGSSQDSSHVSNCLTRTCNEKDLETYMHHVSTSMEGVWEIVLKSSTSTSRDAFYGSGEWGALGVLTSLTFRARFTFGMKGTSHAPSE